MKVKLGLIGFGQRGEMFLRDIFLPMEEIAVVSVCDTYEDRAKAAAEIVQEATGCVPVWETDYRKVIDNPEVEAVVIAAAWEDHVDIAVYSMLAGKTVAMEVGGAYEIEDCWKLVNTYEATRTPFMFLENCCYGQRELMALNMVKQGLFGEIVHCAGGYHHNIRDEIAFGAEKRHYRLRNYINRNAENYPTHELGPIAKILDINHGNRFLSLTATASKAAGLHEYILREKSDDEMLKKTVFNQGDIVTTVIKCAHGETITLTLDTTLPTISSRDFTVRGTKGLYHEMTDSIVLDEKDFRWRKGNLEDYAGQYEHPVWKKFLNDGVQGGHGGMDWLEFEDFVDCIKNHKPMPIDVYDAAAWMAVTALSEQSIAMGSAPVTFPDFTRGKWLIR